MEIQRLFSAHPASVGESYWGHLLRASWFGGKMLMGAGACFVHALLPFLFVKTGSETILELHEAMVTNRRSVPERRVAERSAADGVDLAVPGQLRVAK